MALMKAQSIAREKRAALCTHIAHMVAERVIIDPTVLARGLLGSSAQRNRALLE